MTTVTDNPQGTLAAHTLPAPDARPAQNSRRSRNTSRPRDTQPGNIQAAPGAPAAQDTATIPVSGLLDTTGGKAFIRSAGYQRGPTDTLVSLTQVRRYELRRGDQVTGAARPAQPGKARERHATLTQVDLVNGLEPQQAAQRPHFAELTPLHPQQRLRLETTAGSPTGRIIGRSGEPCSSSRHARIVRVPNVAVAPVRTATAYSIWPDVL